MHLPMPLQPTGARQSSRDDPPGAARQVREEPLRALAIAGVIPARDRRGADPAGGEAMGDVAGAITDLALSAWRGRSGQRYVVTRHPWPEIRDEAELPDAGFGEHAVSGEDGSIEESQSLEEMHALEDAPLFDATLLPAQAVILAARRDADGRARLLGALACEPGEAWASRVWYRAMAMRGAREMHVHLLAADSRARRAVCADLAAGIEARMSSGNAGA